MTERATFSTRSRTPKLQRPLWKEVDTMTESEQLDSLIDTFANLQRIKTADDWKKEIDYQITLVKAKLEAKGIVTENLEIH